MTQEQNHNKGIYCPQRWWIHAVLIIQLMVYVVLPDMWIYVLLSVLFFLWVEVSSPGVLISDEGIILLYLGGYRRALEWKAISDVSIGRWLIIIEDGHFLPIIVQWWRKDFDKVRYALNERFK